jgi:hypothetical protein
LAEEAKSASLIANHAMSFGHLSDQHKLEISGKVEKSEHLQRNYYDALFAYKQKFKDYDIEKQIQTDHIEKEFRAGFKSWLLVCYLIILPGGIMLTWILSMIFNLISRLFFFIL